MSVSDRATDHRCCKYVLNRNSCGSDLSRLFHFSDFHGHYHGCAQRAEKLRGRISFPFDRIVDAISKTTDISTEIFCDSNADLQSREGRVNAQASHQYQCLLFQFLQILGTCRYWFPKLPTRPQSRWKLYEEALISTASFPVDLSLPTLQNPHVVTPD
jgi:hypothetical protein